MTENQFEYITEWQKKTFGNATAVSKMNHLREEVIELHEAIDCGHPDRRLEFADCFILLFGAAAADGMTYEDIVECIEDKMIINHRRKWGEPKENGVVNHVRDNQDDLPF